MDEHASTDAGTRGRLEIADRVVTKIACHAATAVDGVVESGSTLDPFVGRRLPRASGNIQGRQARVTIEIAVAWPTPLSAVAQEVRSVVGSQVQALAGLTVLGVDVSVARVEVIKAAVRRRVE